MHLKPRYRDLPGSGAGLRGSTISRSGGLLGALPKPFSWVGEVTAAQQGGQVNHAATVPRTGTRTDLLPGPNLADQLYWGEHDRLKRGPAFELTTSARHELKTNYGGVESQKRRLDRPSVR